MGLFGNSEKKEAFTLRNGGNVANGGRTLPNVEINSPRTFEEFGINLEPKNGEVHSIMFKIAFFDTVHGLEPVPEYSEIEKLTSLMQKDGYTILNIKILQCTEDIIRVLIVYK